MIALQGAMASVSGAATGKPSAPTKVVAVPHDASAKVSWTAAATNGSTITAYTVTSSGTPAKTCTTTGTLTCTVTGLANGDSYTFKVHATNGNGTGPTSTASNSVVPASVPGKPTGVGATPGNGSAKVHWSAPPANGTAITKYSVLSTPTGKTCTTTGALDCTVTALTNGTSYTFTVKATNGRGTGPTSTPSVAVVPASPPLAAPVLEGATAGNGSITVTWTAVAASKDGGATITGYVAHAEIGTTVKATTSVNASATTATVSGLTNGTAYRVTVAAVNRAGTGPPATSGELTPSGPPGAPPHVVAEAADTSAEIDWTPAKDNGTAITEYVVTSTPTKLTCTSTGLTCYVTGLNNGTSYTFQVHAVNGHGPGQTSPPSTPAIVPAVLPEAPPSLSAAATDAGAQVTWAAATGNGAPITKYTVTSNPTSLTCTTTGALTCKVTGLTNGKTYTFRVRATNDVGLGPSSPPSNPVVPSTVPGKPTNVHATGHSTSARVTWTVAPTNGSAITGYTATSSPTAKTCTTVGTKTKSCTITGLVNGRPYTFTVRAKNADGTGPTSTPSASVVPASAPTSGPEVTGLTSANTVVTVRYQRLPTTQDGGEPVKDYVVHMSGRLLTGKKTFTRKVTTATHGTATLSTSVTGAPYGVTVKVTVLAKNTVGTGPVTDAGTIVPKSVPAAPTYAHATAAYESAEVTWYDTADLIEKPTPVVINDADNGTPIVSYTVTSTPTDRTCTTTTDSCYVPTLVNGRNYTFTVKAKNGQGTSLPSPLSNTVTPTTLPAAPTKINAAAKNASATVTWPASSTDHGFAVTGYIVTSATTDNTCSTGGALSCTVPNLSNGVTDAFRVRAVNARGDGPRSPSSNIVHPSTVPSAPTISKVTAGNASVQVQWDKPATNGSAILGYTVTSTPTGLTCTSTSTSTSPSCTVTGLSNGHTYTFQVKARNADGTGPTSKPKSAVPFSAPTRGPTITTATSGNASITVHWVTLPATTDGGRAVTGYVAKAYLGTVSGSPKQTDSVSASATSATITGLVNGTSYVVTVAAKNTDTVGPATDTGSLTPSTVPGPPRNPTANAGNSDALVIWTAAMPNGTPVTGYRVVSTPGTFTCTTTTTLTCYVHGLSNGSHYTFTVTATNGRGKGPTSTITAAVTPSTYASAPTGVTATAHVGSATVSWTAPSTDGGSSITTYTATSYPTGKTCAATSSTSCKVTGLANGTTYTFRVRATNATGEGPASAPSNAVTPSEYPTAPTDVTATASSGKARVTWDAATPNGTPVIRYTVVSTPGTITCSTSKVATLFCTVSGLTNGTAYVFRVKAANSKGAGPFSTPSNAVIPSSAPTAAPVITAVGSTNRSVTVTWSDVPAATDGGEAINKYVVTVKLVSGTSKGSVTVPATTSYAKITGLVNGTTYEVLVSAHNPKGTGPTATSEPVVPSTTPGAATDVDAAAANGAASVRWHAAPDDGAAITRYTVTSAPGTKQCTTTGALTCYVTGLTNGDTYTFTVVAHNVRGTGPTSTTSNAVKPAAVPSAPGNVTAKGLDASAIVTWSAPTTTADLAITGYLVTSTPTGKTCSTGGTLTCTVTGLKNGQAYTFRVQASNVNGYGPPSAPSNQVTPFGIPGPPLHVLATAGTKSAKVTWTPPAVSPTPIIGYVATSSPGNHTCTTSGALYCTVSGLTDGASYTFTVVAETEYGSGPPSTPSNAVIPSNGKPGKPGTPTATPGDAQALVTWTAPLTNGGKPITRYTVVATPSGKTCSTTGTLSCTVTGLTNGKAYTFKVRAQNVNGTGPTSTPSAAVTPEATIKTPAVADAGYDMVGSDGGVFVFAPPGTSGGFFGSLPGLTIHVNNIVGMVPTSNDQGYFLVGSDGGVFAFGNAPFLGSLPGLGVTPSAPITGIVPTGTDGGYFLVGQDGGVFAFGNAPFLGSLPQKGIKVDNIIGIAATPTGNGYWVVSSTGEVYAFGAAKALGSETSTSSPVSAIAGTPTGGGYWLVTQNGTVYPFGNANSYGTLPKLKVKPDLPVIGIVHTGDTKGYWLIGEDGGIFAFGDAGFVGSLPTLHVSVTDIVGAVPTHATPG